MAYEIALINGAVGFGILMFLLWREAENPFIKTILLGFSNLAPILVLYVLSKIEELEAGIGTFFTYFMWIYLVWLMLLLIFQLYTYFFGVGKMIFGGK